MQRLPNWLTFLRLLLIPVFVFLLMGNPSRFEVLMATAIFAFAAITDYVDGFIARRYGAVSNLGKLLDPLADKILVMAALVMLAVQRSELYALPWVPGWMVVLVLARELWVTGLRGLAATNGVVLAASNLGKVKSGLQMVSIIMLLLHDRVIAIFGMRLTCQDIGVRLLLLSIVFSVWGGWEYTKEVLFAARSQGIVAPRGHQGPPPADGTGRAEGETTKQDPGAPTLN